MNRDLEYDRPIFWRRKSENKDKVDSAVNKNQQLFNIHISLERHFPILAIELLDNDKVFPFPG